MTGSATSWFGIIICNHTRHLHQWVLLLYRVVDVKVTPRRHIPHNIYWPVVGLVFCCQNCIRAILSRTPAVRRSERSALNQLSMSTRSRMPANQPSHAHPLRISMRAYFNVSPTAYVDIYTICIICMRFKVPFLCASSADNTTNGLNEWTSG